MLEGLVGFLSGVVVSFVIFYALFKKPSDKKIIYLEKENEKLKSEKGFIQESRQNFEKETDNLKNWFENLASKIFNEKMDSFKKDSKESLSNLLNPLESKIEDFKKKVSDAYASEGREKASLKGQIEAMVKDNKEMTQATQNLTKALRGDAQKQGVWGEIVLSRALEASGLKKGEHYIEQGEGLSLKTEDGGHQKPDVIVKMPHGGHIVIDSKVSLTHYLKITSKEEKEADLERSFLKSLKEHVNDLHSKRYHLNDNLITPQFVFMFIPIESIFSLAIQLDNTLIDYAWKKSVVIATPSNLIACLKTVNSIWRVDMQNKNAQEIAQESGRLYDKFSIFLEDFKKMGGQIKTIQDVYDTSLSRLESGAGNIVSRFSKIKNLGAKTDRNIEG